MKKGVIQPLFFLFSNPSSTSTPLNPQEPLLERLLRQRDAVDDIGVFYVNWDKQNFEIEIQLDLKNQK